MTTDNNLDDLAVIIACYDEDEAVKRISEKVVSLYNCEVIVMCAKSNNTFKILKNIKNNKIKVFLNHNDKGKGHALWEGIKKTDKDLICNIDADEQFHAEDIIKLYKTIKHNKELTAVHATRFAKDSNRSNYSGETVRTLGNTVMALMVTIFTFRKITDAIAGFKLWKREFLINNEPIDQHLFYEFELIWSMFFQNLKFKEVPVTYSSRTQGVSRQGVGNFQLSYRGVKFMFWGIYTYILMLTKQYKSEKG
jgi:glycosyltransferase involved in cell wall biosynthesis